MPSHPQPRGAVSRPRKKSRTLENTVSDIANRPPPIRRSIFDLLDTLIASRERPADAPPADSTPAPRGPRPRRKGPPENPESR